MQLLEQLASGDPEIWNEAFRCLYPVAFEAARTRLGDAFIEDCKEVAMETLSDILEKGIQVNSETELKPLTAAIARNKATDRLRRHLAEKRGGNKVQSLEEMIEANAGEPPDIVHDGFVDHLAVQELRELLTDLSAEVKKEYIKKIRSAGNVQAPKQWSEEEYTARNQQISYVIDLAATALKLQILKAS